MFQDFSNQHFLSLLSAVSSYAAGERKTSCPVKPMHNAVNAANAPYDAHVVDSARFVVL